MSGPPGPGGFFKFNLSFGRRILFKVVHPLSRLRSGLTGTLALTLSAFVLTACIVTADQSVEGNPKDPRAQDIADKIKSIDLLPRQTAETGASGIQQQGASRPAIYLSDDAVRFRADRARGHSRRRLRPQLRKRSGCHRRKGHTG
jgi:hypothetical protein